ncbi:hypothetical protein DF048_22530 [Burkholderia seminalis]|nr:hypothetical protein DF032_23370 [Burkholderia seminalis]RQS90285.1 hypothetical protein DF048_22530 [Burkholderia seminalis]
MSAVDTRVARHACTPRGGDERACDAAARSHAGAPKQRRATCLPIRIAMHRAAAAIRYPNGRRRPVPFDFDRPRA